jgi:translation initiation factor IF-3
MVSSDTPPICKIMDYGKFLYHQKKGRSRSPTTKLKEVKLTPVTDTHDLNVRLSRAREFLGKGHKVKVTVVMHGRHRKFQDQAQDKARLFFEALEDISQIDGKPQLSGKYLTMILSRRKTTGA